MNVLVACEFSGIVRDAFRARGHNAWSCDILSCDADPRYHFKCMVEELLRAPAGIPWPLNNRNGTSSGPTSDWVTLPVWDLMIAHPPCTYLCNSGVRWLYRGGKMGVRLRTYGIDALQRSVGFNGDPARWQHMLDAVRFFMTLCFTQIPRICIENPIPHKHALLPPYTQIIQPWQFGHGETKATCLWLKGLPKLQPTNVVSGRAARIHRMSPGPNRSKERSKTYEGIARAMAEQWG